MLRLKLLGGAALERDGAPIRGRATQRRRIAILAVLCAARGRSIGREKLVALLWPEHDEEGARRLLSESLYVLRKELGDGALRTVGDEVGLDAAVVRSDLRDFLDAVDAGDMAAAVAAYGGPLLDGFYVSEAPEFERWVDQERDRLARAFALAMERLAEECERRGDFRNASVWWQRLTAHDPANARAVLGLMSALSSAGEHVTAIRSAGSYVEYLREEIGAAPDPEVVRLAEQLRRAPVASRPPTMPRLPTSEPAPEPASGPASPPEPTVVVADAEPPSEAVSRGRGWLVAAAGGVIAIMLMLLIPFRDSLLGTTGARTATLATLSPTRVAVLYLDDHSQQRELGYLADGLTESLIHELSQSRTLDIVSRNGVKQFRDHSVPFDSMVRVLGAGSVVGGSVQESRGLLRVTVYLVDAATGAQLQSRTIERPLGELFAIEDELASEVSRFLRQRLGREVRVRSQVAGTRSGTARDLFLRAQKVREDAERLAGEPNPLDSTAAPRLLAVADSLLAQARAADPAWMEPLIAAGWSRMQRAGLADSAGVTPLYAQASHLADSVLAREPRNAEALELRGTASWRTIHLGPSVTKRVADSLTSEATRDLQAALAIDPSLARAWSTLSQVLRLQGALPEADVAARRALAEDEYLDEAPIIIERLYRSSLTLGRFDEAEQWCARGRRRFPNSWRFLDCELTLMAADARRPPAADSAWRLFDELHQVDPPDRARAAGRSYSPIFRRMVIARVLARAGLRDSARREMARARQAVGPDPDMAASLLYDAALVQLALGQDADAIALLREYAREKPHLRAYLATDVQLKRLWNDARFQSISP